MSPLGEDTLIILGVPVIVESITAYNTVAATMFSFYEYIVTLREEIDYIWRAKLTWVNALYFTIRYLTLFIRIVHLVFCTNVFSLVPVPTSGCLLWVWFQVISGQVLFLTVEVLLVTRVYAFYGRKTSVLWALVILVLAEAGAVTALIATAIPGAVVIASPLPPNVHAGPCVSLSVPPNFSSLWVPALITHGLLFSAVVIRFIYARFINGSMESSPLLRVFVRDDAWAFAAVFAISLWATLAYEVTEHQGQIALTWHYSVLGYVGARLILNLRAAAVQEINVTTTQAMTKTEMKFATMQSAMSAAAGVSTMDIAFNDPDVTDLKIRGGSSSDTQA